MFHYKNIHVLVYLFLMIAGSEIKAQEKCTQCPSLEGVRMVCVGVTACAVVVGHCGLKIHKSNCSHKEKAIAAVQDNPPIKQEGSKRTCTYKLIAPNPCRTPSDSITFEVVDM